MQKEKLDILFLCDAPLSRFGLTANTLYDYIRAFDIYGQHNYWIVSSIGDLPVGLEINCFDAIIIHWSLYMAHESYLSKNTKEKLRHYQGLKIAFIQDEYRTINATQDVLRDLNFSLLFTVMNEDLQKLIYPKSKLPHLKLIHILTGYVPIGLCHIPVKSISERSIDVFYRGRTIPFWLGRVALEKRQIGEHFINLGESQKLLLDIGAKENERLYGEVWIERISDAKATLGVESAATLLDFDGEIQKKTDAYQIKNPNATFDEVERVCFNGLDNQISTAQISPRLFEAIALRTPLFLYEGQYSNILTAHKHYFPIKKDFSNAKEALQLLKDEAALETMAQSAFEDIGLNPRYSYFTFIKKIDDEITQRFNELRITKQNFSAENSGIMPYLWFYSRRKSPPLVILPALGLTGQLITKHISQLIKIKNFILLSILPPIWNFIPYALQQKIKTPLHRIAVKFRLL